MKKIVLLMLLVVFVIACGRKMMPLERERLSGSEPEARLDVLSKGRHVYQMKCGQCHELKTVTHYTNQRWAEILQQMIPRAKLSSEEKQLLIEFVQAAAKG